MYYITFKKLENKQILKSMFRKKDLKIQMF